MIIASDELWVSQVIKIAHCTINNRGEKSSVVLGAIFGKLLMMIYKILPDFVTPLLHQTRGSALPLAPEKILVQIF